MPELARNYNLALEDLVADDALTFAKRKMLKQMNANKQETIMNVSSVDVNNADPDLINNNFLGLNKLLKSNYAIMKEINNRIKVWSGVKGSKSVIKESDTAILEIFDKIDKIGDNTRTMREILPTLFPVSKYISFDNFSSMDRLIVSYTKYVETFINTKIINTNTAPPTIIFHIAGVSSYNAGAVITKFQNDLLTPTTNYLELWGKFSENWNQSHRPITSNK
jgi:hypothetical protein